MPGWSCLNCAECGEDITGLHRRAEATTLVRLFGLKPGYAPCRCGLSVKARIGGQLRYFTIPRADNSLPDADTETTITLCPPGAAADALRWP